MKNGKGYALVTVLLTVVLIFTVSSVLMSSVFSSRKLVNISEEEMQAIDLAEMGVTHVETAINSLIHTNPNQHTLLQELELLKKQFKNPIIIEDNYSYLVDFDNNKKEMQEVINFYFTSTGTVRDFTHNINGTVKLTGNNKLETTERFPKSLQDISEPYKTENGLHLKNNQIMYLNDSLLVLENLTSKNNVKFTVEHDLFINGNMNVGNNVKINIGGHLFVRKNIEIPNNTEVITSKNISVDGNIELNNNGYILAKGSMFTGGSLILKNNAMLIVNQSFHANTVNLRNNAILEIHGDAYFNKEINKRNNAKICIAGNSYLKQNDQWVDYNEVSNYYCKNNANKDNASNKSTWTIEIDLEYYQEKRD